MFFFFEVWELVGSEVVIGRINVFGIDVFLVFCFDLLFFGDL